MEIKFKLLPPMPVNFIRYEVPPSSRQNGIKEIPGIDIIDLDENQAEQYGELMKQAFIKHYKIRKSQKDNEQNKR